MQLLGGGSRFPQEKRKPLSQTFQRGGKKAGGGGGPRSEGKKRKALKQIFKKSLRITRQQKKKKKKTYHFHPFGKQKRRPSRGVLRKRERSRITSTKSSRKKGGKTPNRKWGPQRGKKKQGFKWSNKKKRLNKRIILRCGGNIRNVKRRKVILHQQTCPATPRQKRRKEGPKTTKSGNSIPVEPETLRPEKNGRGVCRWTSAREGYGGAAEQRKKGPTLKKKLARLTQPSLRKPAPVALEKEAASGSQVKEKFNVRGGATRGSRGWGDRISCKKVAA